MANVKTEIKRVEFIIDDELTHCNVFYTSDEPGNPAWGGGWKTKTFPKTKSAVDILKDEVKDFIMWNSGHERALTGRDNQMPTQPIKLIVTEHGDSSVGIFDTSWEVLFPHELDINNLDKHDQESLEFFRTAIENLYKEYCDGRVSADWDHELKQEAEDLRRMEEKTMEPGIEYPEGWFTNEDDILP